jgi:hypothetical protein
MWQKRMNEDVLKNINKPPAQFLPHFCDPSHWKNFVFNNHLLGILYGTTSVVSLKIHLVL